MKLKKLAAVCCTIAMAASVILPAGIAAADEAAPEAPEGTIVIDAATPIEVTGGQITGTTSEDGQIAIYKGIPYAQPPVGDLRWVAPMDPEPWEGVKACDEFGPIAWQSWPNFDMPWMYVYSPEFLASEERDVRDEDCLYLNVWTKQGETDGKRPVVVYIHGGGFGEGSGSIPVYDGTNLAEDDIVFVNINYRLGTQGFLTIEELDEESPYGTSGNYGIIDCVKALEWVNANIDKFGGDPDNITIAGQSAGGMAVNALIGSHIAADLFNNAVVFSGGYMNLNRGGLGGETKEEAQAAFRETYPDVTLEELRALTIEEVFDNYPIGNTTVIDHAVIGEGNVESRLAGDFNPVNVMIGYVNGDAGLFSGGAAATTVDEYYAWLEESYGEDAEIMKELYPVESDDEVAAVCNQISYDRMVMAAWAEALMETYSNDKSAFIYFVDHEAPADVPVGMFHTGDIPYWLGGTLVDRAQYETDVDHAMYQTMKGYFENFITKADPNGEGLPQWDEFDGSYKYMLIGDDTYEMTEIPKERGDYWVSVLNSIYEDAVDTACMAMIADEEIGEEIAAEVAEEVLPTVEGSIFVAPLRPENAQALMDLFAVITGEEGESSFDLAMMLVGEEEPTEEEIEALKSELEGFEEALSYGYLTEVGTALIDAGALGLEDGDVVKGVVMIEGKPAVTEAEVVEGVIALEVIEPSVCFMFTDAD